MGLNLTQRGLAKKLKVDGSAPAHWESGDTSPSIDLLPALADELGTTIEALLVEPEAA
jgi:transcriptional regulator with XRE-family HTH domain